jgi:localization factor PodJL
MGLDEESFEPPRAEVSDRKHFLAMARQAAEKAHAQSQLSANAGQKGGAESPGRAAASLKDRILKAPQGTAPKAGVRPGMLLAASVAAFVLFGAGYYVLGPKSRSAGPAVQRVQPAEAPGKASRSAPALIEDDAAIEPQGGAIQKQGLQGAPRARTQDQQSSAEPLDADTGSATADAPRQVPRAAETNLSTGALGIAIQDGRRDPTVEEMMRARQRAQLASLSERTAQNAALNSTVPEAAVPAGIREDGREVSGSTRPMLEMPPLQIGPSSLRHAAARGDASAQFEVAARFAEGKGVTQSFEQAALWYERAASQGLAQAQYRLATLYERGLGVKGDLAKARLWYQRAALLGNLKAMHNLAVLSAGRDQSDPDYATATHWFTEAAEHGLADSQFNLGILNESGLGMPKDLVTAYKWYSLAAAAGDKDATRRRDLLKAKLDPASLASAQGAVQSWRRRPSDPMVNEPRVAGDAWKRTAQQATR